MPTPPAAFSPLATTRSGMRSARSSGIADARPSRPGLPTTSPMNRRRISGRRGPQRSLAVTSFRAMSEKPPRARRRRPTPCSRWRASPSPSASGVALREVSLEVEPRRAAGGARAERRRQDDAALDPRRHHPAGLRPDPTARTARSAGCRSRPASTGGSRSRRTCASSPAWRACEDVEGTIERMLDQTGLAERRARPGLLALRRQPAADQHRDRAARRSRRAAARRAELGARPEPARPPLGVRRAPRRGRDDGHLLDPPDRGGEPLRRPPGRARRRRDDLRRQLRRSSAARRARGPRARAADPENDFVRFLQQRGH